MTAHAPLFRFFPALVLLGIATLSYALSFNGLYGQDAHEYLRQSQVIFSNWQHGFFQWSDNAGQQGQGYPVAGALLRFLTGDPLWAMQWISWLGFVAAVCFFERILHLLSHGGSRADSRWIYTVLGLALAPVMVKAGITAVSDSLGLAFSLGAFYGGLKCFDRFSGRDALLSAGLMALAISTHFLLAALLWPLALWLGWRLIQQCAWGWLAGCFTLAAMIIGPQVWLSGGPMAQILEQSLLGCWSGWHFFSRTFSDPNMGVLRYWLPNILYLAYPLGHPAFCITLPGLLLLGKRTDLTLQTKRVLLACIALYLFLLGGLCHQNLRYLLPVYALLLLLLFPAWDRMYCYGLIFFKRLTLVLLGLTLLCQIGSSIWQIKPVLSRNRLEREIAGELGQILPAAALVYGFDLDVALKTYLPEVSWRNLGSRRYHHFNAGEFVLFNEQATAQQWAGQNPMINWQEIKRKHPLETGAVFRGGWVLYTIGPADTAIEPLKLNSEK